MAVYTYHAEALSYCLGTGCEYSFSGGGCVQAWGDSQDCLGAKPGPTTLTGEQVEVRYSGTFVPFTSGNCPDLVVNAPPTTLFVNLTATPNSGPSGFNSDVSALVSGTATGTINYYFWWNCANTSNDFVTVEVDPACGDLPSTCIGCCAANALGYHCEAISVNPQNAGHAYTANSTAKVIVERGTALPAEDREPITVIANSPPVASNVTVTEPNYCAAGPSATVTWTYSDPNGHPQSAYQVQIDDTGSAWNTPVFDSGKVLSSGTSFFQSGLLFNVTYKVRARVWDSLDLVGNWTEMSACNGPGCLGDQKSWKTPKHAYPAVDFTWSPLLSPSANQLIQFTDLTTFYNDDSGAGQRAWNWLFGDSGTSTLQNPTHTYASAGSYNVTETVTDKDGYQCARTKPLNIQRPIPIWKEVSPK